MVCLYSTSKTHRAYGNPEITKVDLGVRKNPGILISGHDLKRVDPESQSSMREQA